jgi:DNA-binding HxlR family transcriptional regulator
MRFSRLREQLGGISQKMLTKTLRQLERDGLVTRHVHAVVPPRVDYKLTPLGDSLGQAVCGIWIWAEEHLKDVEQARQTYDLEVKLSPSNGANLPVN